MMKRVFGLLLASSLLLLSACGFQPMYGQKANSPAGGALLPVTVAPIGSGHMGQLYHTALEDLLNPPGSKAAQPYTLNANIIRTLTPIIMRGNGTILRYNAEFISEYTLVREDGVQVLSGKVSYIDSYNNNTDADFSTFVAENDATKRGTYELAEKLRLRLGGYFARREQ